MPRESRQLRFIRVQRCGSDKRVVRRNHSWPSTCAALLVAVQPGAALFGKPPRESAGREPVRVAIVSGANTSYRIAAAALGDALTHQGFACLNIELPATNTDPDNADTEHRLAEFHPQVIAAAGTRATLLALAAVSEVPVVFFMVPNALDAAFLKNDYPGRHRLAGVTSDVSPAGQIDWIRRTQPAASRIAVLHSPRSVRTARAIQTASGAQGVRCELIETNRAAIPRAIEALQQSKCDGVLMIPDAKVYNSAVVQRLLLWGIRNKKPVWAFSEKVARAGALAGQFPDYRALGRQAADLVRRIADGADPATIGLRYPETIGHAVNNRTASLIGVALSAIRLAPGTVRYGVER